jgi:molecular chaperone HtpG
MTSSKQSEIFSFQAEVVQVLDLLVHSLYSNKEIFLRELISNASDAIDRLRFEAFSQPELLADDEQMQIWVSCDPPSRTITVRDNGIGMSKAEVIDHIGTIARSGTRQFLQTLSGDQRKDAALIGQFGVGFYSAFVVADKVTLTTLRAGLPAAEGVRWESDGRGQYTLSPAGQAGRGTEIVLHLRDGEDDMLNSHRLRAIIQKYSDHVSLPIFMPAEPADYDDDEDDDDEGEQTAQEGELVNQASALWARPKSQISEQDYHDFYRHVSGDHAAPLAWLHSKVEGAREYTLLLFIPSHAPFDLWTPEARRGVRLHVNRVFIMEEAGQLLPMYLRFVRGVIDSSDLPLNVSRELLQSSRTVDHIRSTATKKILKLLGDLAQNDPGKYSTFWRECGSVLKEGIVDDYSNRDEIAMLLRFSSTKSGSQVEDVSLADYVARMKEGQEEIYYLLAPALADAASSPHLEAFRAKDIEVLLLGQAVDSWLVSTLLEFDGISFAPVTGGTADFGAVDGDHEREEAEKAATEFAALTGRLKEALDGEAWDVRVTSRLTTSPACIVANRTQDVLAGQFPGSSVLPREPVLEINPSHPLVERLNRDPADPRIAEWAHVLYNQAVLTLGAHIDDPAAFVGQLNDLLVALACPPEPEADGKDQLEKRAAAEAAVAAAIRARSRAGRRGPGADRSGSHPAAKLDAPE